MIKSSAFHKKIPIRGRNKGWHWTGESSGSHRIYEDNDGHRYPVPYHGSKEIGEGLRKKIEKDMELE